MAVVTIVAASDMCRILAACNNTIMAVAAGSDNLGVVDREYRCPDIRRVAVFADIRGLNVGWRFAGGLDAVVAAHAIAGNTDMIEVGR